MDRNKLAQCIDHTLLKAATSGQQVEAVCREALAWQFASVCVPPSFVAAAAHLLKNSPVQVGTVIGFPLGYNLPEVKRVEAQRAQQDGAREVDMAMQVGRFKSGDFSFVERELRHVVEATPGLVHKIIIECSLLTNREKADAVRLVIDSGAEFVKTGTGFGPKGTTLEDVNLLVRWADGKIAVKAAGGISDPVTAVAMVEAGARRIGTSSAVQIIEAFGSRSYES
ncbi:MAG: deoxyribose-phosphate aldolase [bacterium]|nr:deoxyribose-phosphate aldolase [bacterium]